MTIRKNSKHPFPNIQTSSRFCSEKEAIPLLRTWMLRILMKLGGLSEFADRFSRYNDTIGVFLGFHELMERYEESKQEQKAVMAELKEILLQAEQQPGQMLPKLLQKNLARLASLVGLDEIEQKILGFASMLHYYNILRNTACVLKDLSSTQVVHAIAVILDLPHPRVKAALSGEGRLAKSALLVMYKDGSNDLWNKLYLISNSFADKMISSDKELLEIFKELVRPCDKGTLTFADYTHIEESLELLTPYLEVVMEKKQRGVNILLYGQPGTGKTELVKLFAKHLGCVLYEISYHDEDHDPIEGRGRLKALRAAQSFLSKERALLMFDEIEDVFSDGDLFSFFSPKKHTKNKAWINRMLESNPIPTFWVSNSIEEMDEAVIRRFDMSIELPIPPKSKRAKIIQQSCGSLISEEMAQKLSEHKGLAPALLSRAAAVVESVKEKMEDSSQAIETILNGTLKAQGRKGITTDTAMALPSSYDPRFINTKEDLLALTQGIQKQGSARLCLYGPPGTGKSAFGRYLSETLERPLLLKKGSDLLSMWVGGTEKNIANAFREAKEERAVLVFDEVDSFLQDRRNAQRSWEVTEVNEMLTQMESFGGIFIATTNLMEGLDFAAIRRFDLKLKFDYLTSDQAIRLFLRECQLLGMGRVSKQLTQALKGLANLTPGDFATVRRQSRFRSLSSPEAFLERLKEECRVKNEEGGVSLGFL